MVSGLTDEVKAIQKALQRITKEPKSKSNKIRAVSFTTSQRNHGCKTATLNLLT